MKNIFQWFIKVVLILLFFWFAIASIVFFIIMVTDKNNPIPQGVLISLISLLLLLQYLIYKKLKKMKKVPVSNNAMSSSQSSVFNSGGYHFPFESEITQIRYYPPITTTEREEELSFDFFSKYIDKVSKLEDDFYNAKDKFYDNPNKTNATSVIKKIEKLKNFCYGKGKGGQLHYQEMYEFCHNTHNSCFSLFENLEQDIAEIDGVSYEFELVSEKNRIYYEIGRVIDNIRESFLLIRDTSDINTLGNRYRFGLDQIKKLKEYEQRGLYHSHKFNSEALQGLYADNYIELIKRCYMKYSEKANKLKTEKGIQNRLNKFWDILSQYENEEFIQTIRHEVENKE